jgi:hypothetical protein
MDSRTLIIRSRAGVAGTSMYISAGDITYLLPAPAGYWLPNALCQVFRAGCAYSRNSTEQRSCEAGRANCSITASAAVGAGPHYCQMRTFVQVDQPRPPVMLCFANDGFCWLSARPSCAKCAHTRTSTGWGVQQSRMVVSTPGNQDEAGVGGKRENGGGRGAKGWGIMADGETAETEGN